MSQIENNAKYNSIQNFDLKTKIPVPHLQDESEFKLFLWMYYNFCPTKVIELGSFFGATLWTWVRFNENLESITSVDLSIGPGDGRYQQMLESKAKWNSWMERYDFQKKLEFHQIEGNTMDRSVINQVNALYPDNDVDMLFIDADHAYSSVRADYYNYKHLVKTGGWIVFHDTYGYPEVRRLFDEVKSDGLHFEIYNPKGWGISTIIKK